MFTTNVFHAHGVEDVGEIGAYLRGYTGVRAWNVRMAVPVHHGGGERTRTAARRRQLFGTRPRPTLPLRYYHALLADNEATPFPFEARLGNYLTTSLLRHPHALTGFGEGHPCREDARLVTVKAEGQVTQCPILTELDPSLTNGSVLGEGDNQGLGAGFEGRLPLAALHTASMPCHTCPLRPICGGGCRLYALAYEEGLTGCDLPAKALLAWQLLDPTGLLRRAWPAYHQRLTSLISWDEEVARLCEDAIRGWDR